MGMVQEHLFLYIILTWHFDTRINATDLMLNRVAGAWDYNRQAYNASARFTVAFKDLLGRNWREIVMCIGYWTVNYATSPNVRSVR
jgi:hypothetical protein